MNPDPQQTRISEEQLELDALLRELDDNLRGRFTDIESFDIRRLLEEGNVELLHVGRFDRMAATAKNFLDRCNDLLSGLMGLHPVAAAVYNAVKFILAIAAAKVELRDELQGAFHEMFCGLPLITATLHESNSNEDSSPENRFPLSAMKAYFKFINDAIGILYKHGSERWPVLAHFRRIISRRANISEFQEARKKMKDALGGSQYAMLVKLVKSQNRRELQQQLREAKTRLHLINYEGHLARHSKKTNSVANPCSWAQSHKTIKPWLSQEPGTSRLAILGAPGTGKSVFTARMIDMVSKAITDEDRDEVLIYYFCGEDISVGKTSSETMLASFLRQILCNYPTFKDIELDVLDGVLSSDSRMFQEVDLKKWISSLLGSFSSVSIIIDALDHCEEAAFSKPDGLIPWLLDGVNRRVLFVGSDQVLELGDPADWSVVTLGRDEDTTQADLAAFARSVVQTCLNAPHGRDRLQQPVVYSENQLVDDLIQHADNMFLYIFLLKDIVDPRWGYNRDVSLQRLRETPPGVYNMYSSYLLNQLRRTATDLPSQQRDHDRVFTILLRLLAFSPSPVTWDMLLEALRLERDLSQSGLLLDEDSIESIMRLVAGLLFDVQQVPNGRKHLIPVHKTFRAYFSSSNSLQLGRAPGADNDQRLHKRFEDLYHAVAARGAQSLLDTCCEVLRNSPFLDEVYQYQCCADVQRVCYIQLLDMKCISPSPLFQDHLELPRQLFQDTAFSICDSLGLEISWLDCQFTTLAKVRKLWNEVNRGFELLSSEHQVGESGDHVERIGNVLMCMNRHLELGQGLLSQLKTRHLEAYAVRNIFFYLHLTQQQIAPKYLKPPVFENLLSTYLNHLSETASGLASEMLAPKGPNDRITRATILKLSRTLCLLESGTAAVLSVHNSRQKEVPSRLLVLANAFVNLWRLAAPPSEEMWSVSCSILLGSLHKENIGDTLFQHVVKQALALLEDAERVCFDHPNVVGIGKLALSIRQLRQMMLHDLLLSCSLSADSEDTGAGKDDSLSPPNIKDSENGFMTVALLRNVATTLLSGGTSQPSIALEVPARVAYGVLVLAILLAIFVLMTTRRICIILSLFSVLPDIYVLRNILWLNHYWLPFASSSAVMGCSWNLCRNEWSLMGRIIVIVFCIIFLPFALLHMKFGVISSRLSQQGFVIFANNGCAVAALAMLLTYPLMQSPWSAMEMASLVYAAVAQFFFFLDKDGVKRQRVELKRIAGKHPKYEEKTRQDSEDHVFRRLQLEDV